MSKEIFFDLLRKYLDGKCTEEEKRIVEQWYSMLDGEELPTLQEADLEVIGQKLWDRVDHALELPEKPVRKKTTVRRLWPAITVAASITGLVVMATFFMHTDAGSTPAFMAMSDSSEVLRKTNNSNVPLTVRLHDSSTVILQPGASLTYPARFASDRREVVIQGEGLFEVTKNTARPFFVYSQRLVTRVVGTSFIVKANDHAEQSEVTVLTGKVMVAHHEDRGNLYQQLLSPKKEVELTPNYKAVYHQETNSLMVTIADNPVPLLSDGTRAADDFVFNGEPMRGVLAAIETTYGIHIKAGKDIDKCTFTGDLSNQDLYARLEFVCQAIGATYAVNGAEINVKGGNCR